MRLALGWMMSRPISILFGVALGLVIAITFDSIERSALDAYDKYHPVVSTTTAIVSISPDEVLLAIGGVKHRACEFRKPLQAFGVTAAGGSPVDLYIERVDRPEYGTSRPLGPFAASLWRVHPRAGIMTIKVYSTHVCNDRVVTTLYAEVRLP